ncbi:MAG: hypothetical protein IT281_05410 [Ignavibacteria bacterium]|nr:hypothetical protein [Ignavibacteria bacterium]
MMYRGKKYEDAIRKLRELKAEVKLGNQKLELRTQYKSFMEMVCKEFSISEKTVYRDMNKPVPGLRKNRNDRGKYRSKITDEEILKAEEIMKAGQTKKTVKKKLGVSNRKMKRINSEVSKQDSGHNTQDSVSNFGNEAKVFFEKLFEMNLIAPKNGIKLDYQDLSFIVPKADLGDIILILSNAYNRSCFADEKKLKVGRDELRNMMMHHLIEDQMRLAQESRDYKMIEAITRMRDRMSEDSRLPDDFDTLLKVCKEIKPDISKEDVISLIKKVSLT